MKEGFSANGGLNAWARNFLFSECKPAYYEQVVRIYPNGHREEGSLHEVFVPYVTIEPSGEYYEASGGKKPLYKYTFPDGRVYFEKVQGDRFFPNHVAFLVLQDEMGGWIPKSRWAQAEITAGEPQECA